MKRIKIVGLCVVCACAFSAMIASAASAAAPEQGQCVAQKKGNYTDANCTKMAEKKGKPVEHKGTKEWKPGAPSSCVAQKKGNYTEAKCEKMAEKKGKPVEHKGSFEKAPGPSFTSSGGPATLKTPAFGGPVTCTSNTATGELTGVKSQLATFSFHGCETAGKKCESTLGGVGNIVTPQLEGIVEEPKPGEVATGFQAIGGPTGYSSQFECEGLKVRTTGYVSGLDSGNINVMSNTSKEVFELGDGKQELKTEISVNGGVSWLGPEPSIQEASGTTTYASTVEIKS